MKGRHWLAELPSGWKAQRADAVLDYRKLPARTAEFELAEVFHYSIPAIQETGDGVVQNGSEIESDKIRLEGGELIVSKLNPRKGCVLLTRPQPIPIVCSTEFVPLVARSGFDARFAFYVYSSTPVRELISAVVQSVTRSHQRATPEDITKIWIPVPPLTQQRAIADYLDRETARLDALVAAKERVLGLLAEKRRALITRAVTRGLDPRASVRNSGIPWLGEIPEHWEVVALRFLVDISGGATPDTGKPEFWDGGIPWVSPKDMKRAEIGDAADHVSPAALSVSALRLIDPVAVLIVVRGMILAHSFPTATTTRQITINQDMKALRCRSAIEPYFLRDFFWGVESHLVALVDSAAHGTRKLETEVLGRFEVCVPPLKEQRAIVACITEKTARLDELCSATDRTIALLKERRAALIAAAVTGKVDVQEAVA
ncbi:MAG: restriction endonuclease subunit S [Longimicrobiales bacterium]|nr:restriction endonuclease subunit S [Longimicrobiales bacterium]